MLKQSTCYIGVGFKHSGLSQLTLADESLELLTTNYNALCILVVVEEEELTMVKINVKTLV